MAMVSAARWRVLPQRGIDGPPSSGEKVRMFVSSFQLTNSFRKTSPSFSSYRISARPVKIRLFAYSNGQKLDDNFEANVSSASSKEASLKIKLPRRNMIVQFTCNSCGASTQRRINRVAYERGTVFVQCAGCLINHKLIDNLGLIVEYDLREEVDSDLDGSE
ncbi:hypothetical protein HPP92_000276 [Vanilla planifolia]|uniref:DNL-type domain-containing protein n=1 Tax=Vanilla planifolia TaxID=51239 RepID=A0A835RW34_VANPL|nr:hypothetical protein HPP92_000276 [Vanilla planifolia]